jgi:alpha-glucosidase
MTGSRPWWESAVIYQVYPRSFQDTDNDGVGDLNGITKRLSYFVDLGVDAIWISPIFRSPMADFGYDISDYVDIDPIFGNMGDFERLVAEAHARGIRVSSTLFRTIPPTSTPGLSKAAARGQITNAIGTSGAIRRRAAVPPNNWLSEFGGSVWELDEASAQYYCHAFLNSQPDLNWRNPAVVEAMPDVLRSRSLQGIPSFYQRH